MTSETFHVRCAIGPIARHTITIMAADHAEAQRIAESRGHTVVSVRRAPARTFEPWNVR